MDTALRTDDLIREIFTHLRVSDQEEVYDRDSTTLYNAALSCKRFSSHALDALWFSSYNLAPLLRLIPKPKQLFLDKFCSSRSLEKGDLSTFDRYAKRIQEYHEFDLQTATHCSVHVILDVLQCLNRHYLLPNLRHLYIHSVDPELELPDFNSYLICPSLRYLRMSFNGQVRGHIESDFLRIVQLAPRLRRLEISNVPIPESMLPLISHFRLLQELSASNDFVVSSDTFLSAYPFADKLEIWCLASIAIGPEYRSTTHSLGSSGYQFSALTELELEAPKSIEAISEVFAHNLFPCLKTLVVTVCVEFTDGRNGGWAKLFSALFSKQNCLQDITIYQRGNPARYRFNPGDIDIFALLQNGEPQPLKDLTVLMPLKKRLPTSSMRSLVSVFPRLIRLKIAASQILFADLVLLAQGLPHLLELWIGVDGRTLPHPNDIHAFPLLSHGLESILLRNSDIPHPAEFARWLDRLFPAVRVITVDVPQQVHEMAAILASMRPIREDQEARIHQKTV